jgi:ATP-dependent RNA helicase RhlE
MSTEEILFSSFNLDPRIQKALDDKGYKIPTPIQAQAIPHVLAGTDVMGAAQTGTGKTAAFTLPILQRMLQFESSSTSPARHPVRSLMLAPTRELADQIAINVQQYAKHTALRSAVIFGGMDMRPQTEALRNGVELVIATPGRLLDHVQAKSINLSTVQVLVLDEADRMLDMGFLPDLQRIVNLCPKERQTLLFSATFSPEIRRLAASFQRNPVGVEVARSNATADTVVQTAFAVEEAHKNTLLLELLRAEPEPRQVLVFLNSKLETSKLARILVREGFKADAIHGDKSQSERLAALAAFKSGECEILVATDVAARGLDIVELPCVINYDVPFNAEDYVHRIGRTGRAGQSGRTIMLVEPRDSRSLREIEALIKRKVELQQWQPPMARPRARSEWGDRPERPERSERPARAERNGSESSYREPVRKQAPLDPFFTQPYEPATQTASGAAEAPTTSASMLPKPGGKRPALAALLGGRKAT